MRLNLVVSPALWRDNYSEISPQPEISRRRSPSPDHCHSLLDCSARTHQMVAGPNSRPADWHSEHFHRYCLFFRRGPFRPHRQRDWSFLCAKNSSFVLLIWALWRYPRVMWFYMLCLLCFTRTLQFYSTCIFDDSLIRVTTVTIMSKPFSWCEFILYLKEISWLNWLEVRASLPDLCHAERARFESQLAINILLVHFTSFHISSRSLIPTLVLRIGPWRRAGWEKRALPLFQSIKVQKNGVGKINRRN